ncbi:ABC transporter substrate-binding protein [Roseibacterium sp. SDUM158016]|uniref:ABC transporter substrate-binding protein n=1 Tax=Roseicyclus sediminis TaxID=2980997 RepID=UPI0021D10D71|nr:ABC transporter substrate-binding protein [Roseibacterium sp. SDUM158016]MCU4653463.1 ABC transporter substrate-binding protein [Roseibacterium sp. SDUM158016]
MSIRLNRRRFLGTTAALGAAAAMPWRPAHASTPFTMQAAWINDAEFAGYFIGIDEGYYSDEGLDLTYLSGGPDVIPESTIIAGRADLALTTPDTTIRAIVEQGAPFKIIGAQYQKNPIGIVSLASNPILTPQDLVGKTLAVPPVNVISVNAMLQINGIDPNAVNIVPYAYDPTPLIQGEIDASLDFTTNVPYTISQQGVEAVSFLLYDYGFTIYNDTVVVTEEVLAEKRDLLVAWLRASRRGWEANFEDPNLWPPRWADTWFAGTGRTIENEIFFNNAQMPLMQNPAGYFAMSEEDIEANLSALGQVGIVGNREMFDTTLLEEI